MTVSVAKNRYTLVQPCFDARWMGTSTARPGVSTFRLHLQQHFSRSCHVLDLSPENDWIFAHLRMFVWGFVRPQARNRRGVSGYSALSVNWYSSILSYHEPRKRRLCFLLECPPLQLFSPSRMSIMSITISTPYRKRSRKRGSPP